jgi:hypothetical protein
MQESELKLLSAVLNKKNTRDADKNRTLFVWQWQGMGRISEICGLKLQSLKDYTTREMSGKCAVPELTPNNPLSFTSLVLGTF